MTIKLLGTTAIALLISAGGAMAQSSPDLPKRPEGGGMTREQGPRAQSPSTQSKDTERPGAGREADRLGQHAAQPESKGEAREPRRGEAAPAESRPSDSARSTETPRGENARSDQTKRAEEPQPRDTKAGPDQGRRHEQQQGREERQANPDNRAQDQRKPDSRAQDERKPQDNRAADQKKPDNRAIEDKKPGETGQQQGQREPERNRNNEQATQPANPPAQQGARQDETRRDQARGENENTSRTSVSVRDDQRRQIFDRLQHERRDSNENINIRVNVGERLPPSVRPRPLPGEIVRIAPEYRDYEYTVVDNRVVIVNPRTREVVDYIDEPGQAADSGSRIERGRFSFSREQRDILVRQATQQGTTVGSTSSAGGSGSTCLALRPVPDELARSNPELAQYSYLAIGDQIVLVDPREQKIVQLIDRND